MESSDIKKAIKKAFWDVDYSPEQLYDVLTGNATAPNFVSRERIYLRLIESYSWYKIKQIVPNEQLTSLLSDSVIKQIRAQQLRKRYETLAELLRKFTVSAAG